MGSAPENAPVGSQDYGSFPPQLPLTPGDYSNSHIHVDSNGKITLVANGSGIGNLTVVAVSTTPYNVGASDQFIGASASAGSDTVINLPAATGSGRVIIVKKMDSNAHNIDVTPNGTDTIDGLNAADVIAVQYASVNYVDYGAGAWAKF
jgi:hypothetical protein